MFPKKVILPLFAIAMASFVACGDDDSSFNPTGDNSAPNKKVVPDGQLPDTLEYFSDVDKYPCSQTENKCATVYVRGHSHPVQCDGMGGWYEVFAGTVEGRGDTDNNPDIVGPSDPNIVGPTNTDMIVPSNINWDSLKASYDVEPDVQPVDPVEPQIEPSVEPQIEPVDTTTVEPVKPAGDKVACSKGPACTEGPAELASECKTDEGEELLDACPAGGEACDVGEGITMYLYEGAGITCADLLAFMQM